MFFSLHIVGLSSLLGSINSIVTLLKSSNLSIINSFLFLPLQYNSNITFYGIFMTSSMIMSILIGGFGNILLPLMLCSTVLRNYELSLNR